MKTLEQRITALEERLGITSSGNQLGVQEPWKRWRAESGNKYWNVSGGGAIFHTTEENSEFDNFRYATGNYFRTEQEVEAYKEHMLLSQEWKDLAEGYRFTKGNPNWYAYYEKGEYESWFAYSYIQPNTVYFPSKEKLQQALATFGEDKFRRLCKGV